MKLVAVTGGIASGKSAVSARLAEHGAVVVDADRLAREVVEPGTAGLAAIAETFGPDVIASDGSLNRPALGAIIFSDAEKREALNGITHPAIWKRALELVAEATVEDPDAIVIYDVPLLAEAAEGRPLDFDRVVVVQADAATRTQRMVEIRGMSRSDAESRLGSQASDAQRLALADVVIDSNGTLEHTLDQADALWAELVRSETQGE